MANLKEVCAISCLKGMMKRKQWILLPVIVACLAGTAHAQNWNGIIAPSRAIDWSSAGARGGAQTNRSTICATLNPGATATQINNAIAACPSGQVVFLNAGTYNIGSPGIQILKGNVTLRGAGADRTILNFTASNSCTGEFGDICVSSPNLYWEGSTDVQPGGSHAHNWTAGYSKGATQITVDSSSGLSIGKIIALDQANDLSDTGHFSVCDLTTANPPCSLEGGALGRVIGGVTHSQIQFVQVAGINGNVLTISPGLYAPNWSGSKSPGVFWTDAITGVGVENMTLNHNTSDSYAGINFLDADSCWASGIKSTYTLGQGTNGRNHVWMYLSSHITVQNSYFYGTRSAASLSYGVEFLLSGDNLVVNNIFQHVATPIMTGEVEGSVIAYNFGTDDFIGASTVMFPLIDEHDAGLAFLLHEGNDGPGVFADVFHGQTNTVTYFRNYLSGFDASGGMQKSTSTTPVNLQSYNRYYNFVGNVLGSSGVHTTYESFTPGPFSDSTVIYSLGFGDTAGSVTVPQDVTVRNTLMRWGNYDVVNATSRFVSAEVPSGLSDGFANSVPASQTLPSSFYYNSRPNWWPAAKPWPPIGPDVSGGNIANLGGHAYTIPARDCYINTMGGKTDGTSGVLTFNPTACYPQSSAQAPAPPTSLMAVVQ